MAGSVAEMPCRGRKGKERGLSPTSRDVLALSQGRADLFALCSARERLDATRKAFLDN